MNTRTNAIEKILSRNDTGETGGHQSGIVIPKKQEIISFFPTLDSSKKNPRLVIGFYDHLDKIWSFPFIYYNNRLFGGTRNEYRLTGMTGYIKTYNLKSGDTLMLFRDTNGLYTVRYKKDGVQAKKDAPLKLGNKWKVIKI